MSSNLYNVLSGLITIDNKNIDYISGMIKKIKELQQSSTFNNPFNGTLSANNFIAGNHSLSAKQDKISETNKLNFNLIITPTTISGYGITDTKIEDGVITIGGIDITPLTAEISFASLSGDFALSSDVSGLLDTKQNIINQTNKLDFNLISNIPSTLNDYGITDAKIDNGTIHLGNITITPLTTYTETDPEFAAVSGSFALSTDIQSLLDTKQNIISETNKLDFNLISNIPSTLSGYGITDTKIKDGVITIGGTDITPLTEYTETEPAFANASGTINNDINYLSGILTGVNELLDQILN